MEDEPLLNAGIGACLNLDGVVELDAGVMEGAELRAGGAAGLKDVRHPIDLALEIMRDGRHVLLAGDGASRFASEHGIEMADPSVFITDRKRQELLHGADTVGAVARDAEGRLAVAGSTGGINGKLPGRIGDSPIPRAGFYADDRFGAGCGTGPGEGVIRLGLARVMGVELEAGVCPAEGWAKVTRQVGVAAVTAGPGVTNAATALAQAQSGDSPIFVIGGRAPAARWGMGSLQEMDHLEVVRSLTKKAVTLESAEEAYGLAAECMRTALSRRTGPTFMDVPLDTFMFSAPDVPEATEHLTPDLGSSPDPDLVQHAARLIREAERPAVIAGGTVWWAHAEVELKDLIETASLPLVVNGMARGVLPPGHPLFVQRARGPALGEADLIVVIGALLDFRLNYGQPPVFAEDARLIYIDADAYRKPRPAEVAIYGDVKAALAALVSAVHRMPERTA